MSVIALYRKIFISKIKCIAASSEVPAPTSCLTSFQKERKRGIEIEIEMNEKIDPIVIWQKQRKIKIIHWKDAWRVNRLNGILQTKETDEMESISNLATSSNLLWFFTSILCGSGRGNLYTNFRLKRGYKLIKIAVELVEINTM